MRIQPTKIEQLDRKHPGLRLEVDLLLDGGGRTPGQGTLEDVRKLLAEKYDEYLPINTISNYKQHRWLIEKLRLRELKETFRAVKEELGDAAISESTQARLLELLDQAMRAGATLDPYFLLKEQRLWAQHEAKVDEIENDKRKLELEIQRRETERQKVAEAIGDGEKDPKQSIQRIREIYGLGAA